MATSEAARELGKRGGRRKAERAAQLRLASIGLDRLLPEHDDPTNPDMVGFPTAPHLRPFLDDRERWLRSTLEDAAATLGGGQLSAAVMGLYEGASWCRLRAKLYSDLHTRRALLWNITPQEIRLRHDIAETARSEWEAYGRLITRAADHAASEAEARLEARARGGQVDLDREMGIVTTDGEPEADDDS